MWGGIVLETVFSGNYVFGFLTNRSNNLLHLTHWQYWFWFFFTWFLVLYYIIFVNFFFKRSQHFSMKLSTSFRSHGKWGDFIVCVVPISWCLNILTNSNFILRLVEWQSESSLFSLRVRGKQWYWVYKIDYSNHTSVSETTKQLGNYSWASSTKKNNHVYQELLNLQNNLATQSGLWSKNSVISLTSRYTPKYCNPVSSITTNSIKTPSLNLNHTSPTKFIYTNLNLFKSAYKPINLGKKTLLLSLSDVDIKPTQLNKTNVLKLNTLQIHNGGYSSLKKNNQSNYFIIKQKRFSYKTIGGSSAFIQNTKLNNVIELQTGLKFLQSTDTDSQILNKRLLRTTKLLVLPTNTNISVITNSFDVIHSWFIPGLGLKLDCVPGRSTHHTLHILNPGFYYGQCAEICGRYHHHMPIRVCALSFPHFIFWWNNRALPQLFQTNAI